MESLKVSELKQSCHMKSLFDSKDKYCTSVVRNAFEQTFSKYMFLCMLIFAVLERKCRFKASLTFKCMTEHLFADFSYSIALDTYL